METLTFLGTMIFLGMIIAWYIVNVKNKAPGTKGFLAQIHDDGAGNKLHDEKGYRSKERVQPLHEMRRKKFAVRKFNVESIENSDNVHAMRKVRLGNAHQNEQKPSSYDKLGDRTHHDQTSRYIVRRAGDDKRQKSKITKYRDRELQTTQQKIKSRVERKNKIQ